jgi:monoterpene epsilon-lactone hydrolase
MGRTQSSGRLGGVVEETIAGVTVRRVTPVNINPANENRLFVHTHGGAYVVNNGRAGLFEAILIAHRAAIPVLSIDYRMPPEYPFPAGVDDIVAVWKSLLADRNAKFFGVELPKDVPASLQDRAYTSPIWYTP